MKFGWIDFSPEHRKKLETVLDLFQDKQVLDELGIGPVRDAFSNTMFPGTTTIQTRAKYFLLVPWIMQEVERDTRKVQDYRKSLHELEYQLIDILCKGEDLDGIIGRYSRRTLKRKPSSIYWNGMKAYGIINWPGSMESYLQYMRRHRLFATPSYASPEEKEEEEAPAYLWASVPRPPEGWKEHLSIHLTFEEAQFLKRQIIQKQRGSLWATILADDKYEVLDYPSIEPLAEDLTLPEGQRHLVQLAVQFNQLMKGALILYNIKIKESVDQPDDILEDAWELYLSEMDLFDWHTWNTDQLWNRFDWIGRDTKNFVWKWISLLKDRRFDTEASELLRRRELNLKGIHRARLSDKAVAQKLEEQVYPGMSIDSYGNVRYLDYRWRVVIRLLSDIKTGLDD